MSGPPPRPAPATSRAPPGCIRRPKRPRRTPRGRTGRPGRGPVPAVDHGSATSAPYVASSVSGCPCRSASSAFVTPGRSSQDSDTIPHCSSARCGPARQVAPGQPAVDEAARHDEVPREQVGPAVDVERHEHVRREAGRARNRCHALTLADFVERPTRRWTTVGATTGPSNGALDHIQSQPTVSSEHCECAARRCACGRRIAPRRGLTLECTPRHTVEACPLRRRTSSTAAAHRPPL